MPVNDLIFLNCFQCKDSSWPLQRHVFTSVLKFCARRELSGKTWRENYLRIHAPRPSQESALVRNTEHKGKRIDLPVRASESDNGWSYGKTLWTDCHSREYAKVGLRKKEYSFTIHGLLNNNRPCNSTKWHFLGRVKQNSIIYVVCQQNIMSSSLPTND